MYLLGAKILFNMAEYVDDGNSLLRYIQNINNVSDINNASRKYYRALLATFDNAEDDDNDEKVFKYAIDGKIMINISHKYANKIVNKTFAKKGGMLIFYIFLLGFIYLFCVYIIFR